MLVRRLGSHLLRASLVVSIGVLGGCGGGGAGTDNVIYARSVNGTEGGYSFKHVVATPATLLVAHKIQTPLYLVLDPSQLKDRWPMQTSACATGAKGCERFTLFDVHEFVRRDLKAAFEHYFMRVEVILAGQPMPSEPHVVADVKIDSLAVHDQTVGFVTYARIEMTWALALRRSDQSEYAYSFAGMATSKEAYPTFEAGCGQLVENAITGMTKKWVEDGGMKRLGAPGGVPSSGVGQGTDI